ncbi:GrpB family protein [Nocardia sp. NPDC004168]|uniref:GrpB family protein n=1 Tax=Nocardia sp. NPDC004168 TaxID=3154452 RepID=UPI0033A31F74
MATLDDDDIAAATVGDLRPYAAGVMLEEYNPAWPVPPLAAKAVIDILLLVPDAAAEVAYLSALEAAGYELRIRQPDWYQHRCFVRRVDSGARWNVNLHVLSPESGGPEIERILAFRDWLRTHEDDRAYYERTKRELTQREWKFVQHYANAKSGVVEEILGRALFG